MRKKRIKRKRHIPTDRIYWSRFSGVSWRSLGTDAEEDWREECKSEQGGERERSGLGVTSPFKGDGVWWVVFVCV